MFKSLITALFLVPTFAFALAGSDLLKKELILDSSALSLLEKTGLTQGKEFSAIEFKSTEDESEIVKSASKASLQFDLSEGKLNSLILNGKSFTNFKVKSMNKDVIKLFATHRTENDKFETIFVTVKLKEDNMLRKAKISIENVNESDLYTGISGELDLGSKISGI